MYSSNFTLLGRGSYKCQSVKFREQTYMSYTRQHIDRENISLSLSKFPKDKGIKSARLNIRSLKNKTADLEQFLRSNPYDLLGISETWLDADISSDTISIDGYKFERLDRNTLGGGVSCYINERYTYIRRKDL